MSLFKHPTFPDDVRSFEGDNAKDAEEMGWEPVDEKKVDEVDPDKPADPAKPASPKRPAAK